MCQQSPSITIWVRDQSKPSTRNPNLPELENPIYSLSGLPREVGNDLPSWFLTSTVRSLTVKGAIITVNKTAFKHMTDKESTMGEV